MKIPEFEMERMQSTWENLVQYDMSESGVRPVTLRELAAMGLDLDAALDTPMGYSQSNGTIPLREHLAAIYPGATVDHIEVTNGTSEANYLVALSTLEPGDEMAMEVPNYMQLWGVPRSLQAPVRTFRLRPERQWEPDWDEFEQAVTPRTRLLYLSNPNNPSGAVLSDEAMRRIVDRCEATGTWLLADEVYEDLVYQGEHVSIARFAPERTITSFSFSKSYGMAGYRVGYLLGPRDVIECAHKLHTHSTYSAATPSQFAALAALQGGGAWLAETREQNRRTGSDAARVLGLPAPEGSTFLFLDVRDRLGERGMLGFLEDVFEDGVVLAPGASSGRDYEGFVRLCYTAAKPEDVATAVRLLAKRLGIAALR